MIRGSKPQTFWPYLELYISVSETFATLQCTDNIETFFIDIDKTPTKSPVTISSLSQLSF